MRHRCALVWLLAWSSAQAQNAPASGLQVRSISAYTVYDSSFLPNGAGFQSGSGNLPADAGVGGSIAVEWTKFTERSSVSVNYTPTYTGYVRNSNLNSLDHAFTLTVSRKIAPRWTLGFSAAGSLRSLYQSLFSPTTLSTVASVPATFDDLAAAMLSGKFTNNPQLGAILASSPLAESPISSFFYGQRMFTTSAHVSLSYSYSPRLSITFSGGGGRSQQVSQDQTLGTTPVIPNTTTGDANIGISYSLSPFTQLGGAATTSRVSSPLYDSYITTTQATLSHTFARRWLTQIHGGLGFTNGVGQISNVASTKPGPTIGGSLGYKTASHTILSTYERTVSNTYGVGASTSSSATASWHWRRRGNSWWLDSSFSWEQLQANGLGLANTSGWHTTVGLNRAISTQIVLLTEYAHLNYSGGLQTAAYQFSQDAVRVAVGWTPHPTAAR